MKRFITFILCLITVSALYAVDPSPVKTPKPKDNEVILIGNLKFKNDLPLESYRKALVPGSSMDSLYNIYFLLIQDAKVQHIDYSAIIIILKKTKKALFWRALSGWE